MDFLAPFRTNYSIERVDALNKDQTWAGLLSQLLQIQYTYTYNYSKAQVLFKRPFLFVSVVEIGWLLEIEVDEWIIMV